MEQSKQLQGVVADGELRYRESEVQRAAPAEANDAAEELETVRSTLTAELQQAKEEEETAR